MTAKELVEHMLKNGLETIRARVSHCNYFEDYKLIKLMNIAREDSKEEIDFYIKNSISTSGALYGTLKVEIEYNDFKTFEKDLKDFTVDVLDKLDVSIKKEFENNEKQISNDKKEINSLKEEIKNNQQKLIEIKNEYSRILEQVSTLFEESVRLKKDVEIKKAKLYSKTIKKLTRYYTFNRLHTHLYHEFTFDKDVIVKITDENPRDKMVKLFSDKWAFEYNNLDEIELENYPRGIFNVNTNKFE